MCILKRETRGGDERGRKTECGIWLSACVFSFAMLNNEKIGTLRGDDGEETRRREGKERRGDIRWKRLKKRKTGGEER